VRYPDSGGLSPAARAAREAVRFEAAGMFADAMSTGKIAARLRVTSKSVRAWRRRWNAEGEAALVSKGPGGASCRLDAAQLETLQAHLNASPAVHGWDEDQR
jgi:putative transposase